MNSRAQAGLEYLMTYGWALIIIATVIGILVFIVSSPTQNVNFFSSDPTKIMLKGGAATGSTAELKLQNLTGGQINITKITTTGTLAELPGEKPTLNGMEFTSGDSILGGISVPAGSEMAFKLSYTASAATTGNISIDYTDYAGLARTTTVTASGGTGGTTPPAATCNNGAIVPPEVCETLNLNGRTCADEEYATCAGTSPACATDCLSFTQGTCNPDLICSAGFNSNWYIISGSASFADGRMTMENDFMGTLVVSTVFSPPLSNTVTITFTIDDIGDGSLQVWANYDDGELLCPYYFANGTYTCTVSGSGISTVSFYRDIADPVPTIVSGFGITG